MSKTLRLSTKVFDNTAGEFVVRSVSVALPDKAADSLCSALSHAMSGAKITGHSDGSCQACKSVFSTPLRNERRFQMVNDLVVIDNDGTICGGFVNI